MTGSRVTGEPRLVQVLSWRAEGCGRLTPYFEWRDERFLELDRLIALEKEQKEREAGAEAFRP